MRVTPRERGPDVSEIPGEVNVGEDGPGAGARARRAHQREDCLGLHGAAPVKGKIRAARLLDLPEGLAEADVRGPVHHEAHRAVRPVLDQKDHGLREAGLEQVGGGIEEEARPQAGGIPVRGGTSGRSEKNDARNEAGGRAEHGRCPKTSTRRLEGGARAPDSRSSGTEEVR